MPGEPLTTESPRVWGLLGHRRGDNQQVAALCEALAWSHELKQLTYGRATRLPNLLLRSHTLGISAAPETPIRAPWPDLVVAVGRRSVPLALHLRDVSEGRCRLVQIGRPCAPLDWFDLIVTTPQYQLPAAANVVQIPLPFGAPSSGPQVETAALRELPRPHVVVLVGGPTSEIHFGVEQACELAAAAARLVAENGTLLVTTSPRTPPEVAEALRLRLPATSRLHVWTAGAANPYASYLSTADGILVTGDSVSMLADACRTGAPVDVFPLPPKRLQRFGMALVARCNTWRDGAGVLGRVVGSALDSGVVGLPRAYDRVHRAVAERGLLGPLEGRLATTEAERERRRALIDAWEASVVARVRALVEPT